MNAKIDNLNLPRAILGHLERLATGELAPVGQLHSDVDSYLRHLERAARTREFVDLRTADLIARACGELLELLDNSAPEATHRLVQAAVRYFVLSHDAEDDIHSPIGFDDDLRVVCEVARALKLDDVVRLCEEHR